MNGYIVGLMIILGIIVIFLICWGIIQYRFQLKFRIVPIPKPPVTFLESNIVIPDICNTTTNSFFTGSSLNTKSKEEIMYAYY
jgi:hypothetical protein